MQRYFTASFIAGFIVLSLELLGFRLLAPYFGYSLYVYSALIGSVLAALSIGYMIGGRWGDALRSERYVSIWITATAGYIALAAALSRTLLAIFADLPLIFGAIVGVSVLLAVPMIILAALSPYLIKKTSDSGTVGRSAGAIYALSTLGSLLGTFATAIFALPAFGTKNVFFGNAVLTLVVAALLYPSRRKLAVTALVIFALYAVPIHAEDSYIVSESESPYGHLEVVDYGEAYGLRAEKRSRTIYSYMPKDGTWPYVSVLYDMFALPPFLHGSDKALILGLGAGSLPLLHEVANPGLRLTGVEIDPEIVRLGKEYFHLRERSNIDKIEVADARTYLAKTNEKFDLIEIDLFWGGAEIPFYLATREFFDSASRKLSPGGMLSMNVFDPSGRVIVDPITNTIAAVYPYVYRLNAGRGSFFILAAQEELHPDAVLARTASMPAELKSRAELFASGLQRVLFEGNALVLTDDRAPLEKLSFEALESR